MKLSDFDYNLPKELIAQYPSSKRDESRLLVLHKDSGKTEHRIFSDIVEYFNANDILVLNNTKVIPARLQGRKETKGKIEVLVLNAGEKYTHEVLLKPARGCKIGTRLIFGDGELRAEVSRIQNGRRFLRFDCNGNFETLLEKLGEMPLPPYIKRSPVSLDRDRYQTIYASKKGAIAAPTAGLHFTKDILDRLSEKGVGIEYITLHVGYGTFKPVKCEDIKSHKMEKEYFEVESRVIEDIKKAKGRIVTVGTTTCRALETISCEPSLDGVYPEQSRGARDRRTIPRRSLPRVKPRGSGQANHEPRIYAGWTDLFVYPGYKFKAVDALLTNFHLPKTTLLMLVSAFCGKELLFKAYEEAIKEKYRFYSYGDAVLIV